MLNFLIYHGITYVNHMKINLMWIAAPSQPSHVDDYFQDAPK